MGVRLYNAAFKMLFWVIALLEDQQSGPERLIEQAFGFTTRPAKCLLWIIPL